MSKSIKLKDNTYWDSLGISHNKVTLNGLLNDILNCQQTIFTTNNDGVKIKINQEYMDKMPILILGADNESGEPIITVIKTHGNYKCLGYYTAVTSNGTDWHIQTSAYSIITIIAPRGSNIELSNEQL